MRDYVLDDSEYEVLETSESRPITSEEVRKKLDGDIPGPIEQSDFDEKDYTLSDYFRLEQGQYPRNISDHKAEAMGGIAAGGLAMGLASNAGGGYPLSTAGIIGAVSLAAYNVGLVEQDKEFSEAFNNSKENFFGSS